MILYILLVDNKIILIKYKYKINLEKEIYIKIILFILPKFKYTSANSKSFSPFFSNLIS